jgi:parallel beta-helix repeat protein
MTLSAGLSLGMAKPLVLHVAPNGNDNWSGQVADASPDGKDGPLATLKAAIAAARKASPEAKSHGVSILLRGGTYELAEPVQLGPEDSGQRPDAPLLIAAYPGETPVLSGGRHITGWREVAGKPGWWGAEIPEVHSGQWLFRQLFVNGERRQRARTPNQGFPRVQGASPEGNPAQFKFKAGDLKREWVADGAVEVVALLAWADLRMYLRGLDETNLVATLSAAPQRSNKEGNARYYIENAPDALDMPGEWYLNRKTGVLTYWAKAGEDMAHAEVVAPRLQTLLRLEGDFAAEKAVKHVVLHGLAFAYSDWKLDERGYADTQAAVGVRGDIFAAGAVECVVENCALTHLGNYGLELGRGCQNDRVVGNEFCDLGGGGIRVGEPRARQAAFDQNHGHTITDNDIHQGGLVYPPAGGIFVLQSGGNRIAHNHVHHLYYTAVSLGWTWGYRESPCRENIVEFNHLHDLGQGMLSDMGAVYTLGLQPGTIIRNNLIHDVCADNYGGWGLYTDEGSTGILLENNVVYRCKDAGFHQHYGRDNILRNNIFAFNQKSQLMRTREEAHNSFFFTNNIVYFDSGELLGSNWRKENYVIDGNVYFDARPGADAAALRFSGATLQQWRERGHDLNSLVADPRFVAPGWYDFRLRDDSPALKLGFQPIDLSQVGVRPPGFRR